MSTRQVCIAAAALLFASAVPAAAQHAAAEADSVTAELRTELRAFYFNLARRDWEALAAEILSAKVMASHPAPAALLAIEASQSDTTGECSTDAAGRVERARIVRVGDWAAALVPHCPQPGSDRLRLVRFDRRWRIVYIDLGQAPEQLTANS